jgi:hypothetical protein
MDGRRTTKACLFVAQRKMGGFDRWQRLQASFRPAVRDSTGRLGDGPLRPWPRLSGRRVDEKTWRVESTEEGRSAWCLGLPTRTKHPPLYTAYIILPMTLPGATTQLDPRPAVPNSATLYHAPRSNRWPTCHSTVIPHFFSQNPWSPDPF